MGRDELLSALTLAPVEFTAPSGERVYIRGLSALDTRALRSWRKAQGDDSDNPMIAARCLVDATGQRVLTDDDALKLMEGRGLFVDWVAAKAIQLSFPEEPEAGKVSSATTES